MPPQAIPQPHAQPPFLLEELNSLNEGPLQEHPVPETTFDAVPLDDHHGHEVYNHHVDEHHFPDIFDEHFDDHHHDAHHDVHHDAHHDQDQSHLAISSSPAVVVHIGDRTKDKKNDKKDDGKRKKHPPTDLKQDDRYVTHLVAAAPVTGKSVDEGDKSAEAKKPPMEKPTAKQDKTKEGIPTAQTLMRLQNPKDLRLDDNHVYLGATGLSVPAGLNQISANANPGVQVYARPAVKHVVEKENKSQQKNLQKPGQFSKQRVQPKPAQKPRIVWAHTKPQELPGKQAHGSKSFSKKLDVVCPRFCKEFCDRWCVKIGCCKKMEVREPTIANEILTGKEKYKVQKKGKIVAEDRQ